MGLDDGKILDKIDSLITTRQLLLVELAGIEQDINTLSEIVGIELPFIPKHETTPKQRDYRESVKIRS